MTNTNRLKMVYNDNQVIMDAGFTMQSNYILPVLSRMVDEGLLLVSGQTVIQAILSFKHTEDNPYPTRDTLARLLGKSVSYIRKALKSISDAGLLLYEKSGRNNTYNFKPFFSLLERFITEFRTKKNFTIKIKDLMLFTKGNKEEKDFSWTEDIKEEEVAEVTEEVIEEEIVEVSLPDKIVTVLKSNNICNEGIEAVTIKYTAYKDKLDEKLFMQKISASAGKKNFIAFFNTCIDNAYINDEKPMEKTASNNQNNSGKVEMIPEWFNKEYGIDAKNKPKEVQPVSEISISERREKLRLSMQKTSSVGMDKANTFGGGTL